MRSAMSLRNSMRTDSTRQSELLMNSSAIEPIALPSALMTVRPRRVSSDSRIRWLLPGTTVVIPPVARFVIACISIDDPPGQEAARLRQLLSYQRTAPGRECDKNAPENERQGS